jgi:hypothetical protein
MRRAEKQWRSQKRHITPTVVHKKYTIKPLGDVHKNETPTERAGDSLRSGVTSIAHTATISTSICSCRLSVPGR